MNEDMYLSMQQRSSSMANQNLVSQSIDVQSSLMNMSIVQSEGGQPGLVASINRGAVDPSENPFSMGNSI